MLKVINHGEVRELRLARAPVNALNFDLVTQLTRSIRETTSECNALVLSGQERVFSAGLDIVELIQKDRGHMTKFWTAFFDLLETIACSTIPVAAAITGHSPAGGAVITMMCDYRVMNQGKFQIGLNETRVGLIIPRILHDAMQRLIGPGTTEKMIVAGSLVGPEEALTIGLVDALEPDYKATIRSAVEWCKSMLSLPRHSMLGNRAVSRAHFKSEFASHTTKDIASFVDCWFSDETQAVMNKLVMQLKNKK